jgi:hypothetical protein
MTGDPMMRFVLEQKRIREQKKKERVALLMQVDAIEEFLDMPKTSEIRAYAKEHGFYDKYKVVDSRKE